MTPEEILEAALALIADYATAFPQSRSAMYRRINFRQRQLFALASTWNTEYYGVCATGELVEGTCNFKLMEDAGLFPIERIERINIEDPGDSSTGYSRGDRVNIVTVDDYEAHTVPPRALIRSGVLLGVDDDLVGVASVKLFYIRRPKIITEQGDGDIELESPFDELLVYDLGMNLLRRSLKIDADTKTRALAEIQGLEAELLAEFETHVRTYTPVEDRFA